MNPRHVLRRTLTASLVLLLAGCANFPQTLGQPAPNPAPSVSASTVNAALPPVSATQRLADDKSNRYVRLDGPNTGLMAVADDGQNTFAAFANEPKTVEVFNEDGKPIRSAFSKNILAIEGRHRGLLFATPTGNSFTAPNPRAPLAPLEALASDPDVAEARMLLEGRGSQAAAYQRALALATAKTRPTDPNATPSGAAPLAAGTGPAAEDATFVKQDSGVLMRVFFASGGRSIVRPDDGLARLTKEAKTARLIRITGYTDSLGNASWNSLLAQQRAEAIRNHLIKSGTPPERILVGGRGATDFLAENTSEKGRALNRRVEIQLIQTQP